MLNIGYKITTGVKNIKALSYLDGPRIDLCKKFQGRLEQEFRL
jgi:hypothetical protein